jgi:hypothetical protein
MKPNENDKMVNIPNLKTETSDFLAQSTRQTFASRKSYATGLLDIALITSNFAHIKQIFKNKEKLEWSALDIILLCLISVSLLMQLICGLWLIFLPIKKEFATENEKEKHKTRENVFTFIILVITIINIFINVFISF